MDIEKNHYEMNHDVIKTALNLMDDMEKLVISFTDLDCKNNIFKFQKKLLKNIALVKTIVETNSVEILADIAPDFE